VAKEFAALSGRSYGMFEAYELEDAEVGIVVVNSSAGTVKEIVDLNRKKGVKVGVLKPRVFRPFPMAAYADALRHLKAVTVLDRVDSFGAPAGPLAMEVRSALYDLPNRPAVISKIYGLGGRDLEEQHCQAVIDELVQVAGTGTYANLCEYITVRE
jgi:pyruvate ferredoxin oxidoreductase alpha subunit